MPVQDHESLGINLAAPLPAGPAIRFKDENLRRDDRVHETLIGRQHTIIFISTRPTTRMNETCTPRRAEEEEKNKRISRWGITRTEG